MKFNCARTQVNTKLHLIVTYNWYLPIYLFMHIPNLSRSSQIMTSDFCVFNKYIFAKQKLYAFALLQHAMATCI